MDRIMLFVAGRWPEVIRADDLESDDGQEK